MDEANTYYTLHPELVIEAIKNNGSIPEKLLCTREEWEAALKKGHYNVRG